MNNNRDRIQFLADFTKMKCFEWISKDENGYLCVIDPIDKNSINAHYSNSHFAASLLLSGFRTKNNYEIETGISLVKSLLYYWHSSVKLYGYHFDFNNFAFCIILEQLTTFKYKDYDLRKQLEQIIIESRDSNHYTINWLPMRMYVNQVRYRLSNNKKFKREADKLYNIINKATYNDGIIDDILPKGKSFNLQYNISTVAVLEFMNQRGQNYNIDKNLSSLLFALSPEGDINYIGRGCNQVFGWGLWIYLLCAKNLPFELEKSLDYSFNKIITMINNDNIMLNEFEGEEKFLWWDYHYSSVYITHLSLWLELSLYEKKQKKQFVSTNSLEFDSGVRIYKQEDFFLAIFKGRTEYLSEFGPILSNIWIKSYGTIFKGGFGPWRGAFGNNYLQSTIIIRNFIGPLRIKRGTKTEKIIVESFEITFKNTSKTLSICFSFKKPHDTFFNLPIFLSSSVKINNLVLIADNSLQRITYIGDFKNQYGFSKIYHSNVVKAKKWKIIVTK